MNLSACGCLGPMYGEPYCPCTMERMGLDMDNNPLRVAENIRSAEQMRLAVLPGGWLYEMNKSRQ